MRNHKLAAAVLAAALILTSASCQNSSNREGGQSSAPESSQTQSAQTDVQPMSGSFLAMDTVIEYSFYSSDPEGSREILKQTVEDIEKKMSMQIETSEIALLNARAGTGQFTQLSEETFALLARTKGFYEKSAGMFDVTIAPISDLWKIPSPTQHRVPEPEEIEALLPLVNADDIQLEASTMSAHLRQPGQAVDLGAVAKGYGCDLVRKALLDSGVTSGYVSLGGNIMIIDKKPTGDDYKMGVRDPQGTEADYIAVITLPDSTMSTSGDYIRYFEQDGVKYHHIFNPRTGYPAQTDLQAVAIVSPDGAYAEFLSTYLFIMGKEYVLEHINDQDAGIIAIDRDNHVYISQNISEDIKPSDPDGEYQFYIC